MRTREGNNSFMEVSYDTLVISKRGVIQVSQLRVMDDVWTEYGWVPVLSVSSLGNMDGYRVFADSGLSVCVGPNQGFVTDGLVFNSKQVVTTQHLELGSQICFLPGPASEPFVLEHYRSNDVQRYREEQIDEYTGYILGCLFSLLHLEGCGVFLNYDNISFLVRESDRRWLDLLSYVLNKTIQYDFLFGSSTKKVGNKNYIDARLFFQKTEEASDQMNPEQKLFFLMKRVGFPNNEEGNLSFVMKQRASVRYFFVAGFFDVRYLFRFYNNTPPILWTAKNKESVKSLNSLLFSVGVLMSDAFQVKNKSVTVYGSKVLNNYFAGILNGVLGRVLPHRRVWIKNIWHNTVKIQDYMGTIFHKVSSKGKMRITTKSYLSYVVSGSLPPNPVFPIKVWRVEKLKEPVEMYEIRIEHVHCCVCNSLYLHTTMEV